MPTTQNFESPDPSSSSPNQAATPGTELSHDPSNMPPMLSKTGPLSPASNRKSNFVFPMRSVFRSMSQSDSTMSLSLSAEDLAMDRNVSRGAAHHARSPSRIDGKQQSTSSSGENFDDEDDAGMLTIAHLLQRGSDSAKQPSKPLADRDITGTATFTGRNLSHTKGSPLTQPSAYSESQQASGMPDGSFRIPVDERESPSDPFSRDNRRAAEGDEPRRQSTKKRPEALSAYSSATLKAGEIKNDSTPGEGSGLPQKDQPPVGVPQAKPSGINFRDFPGRDGPSAEDTSFSTARDTRGLSRKTSTSSAHTPHHEDPSSSQLPPFQAPRPYDVPGSGRLDGLASSAVSTKPTSATSMAADIEADDEPSLIPDITGIVRLAEPGSLGSIAGRTSRGLGAGSASTRGSKGGISSVASGPTGVRLAQQQRQMALVSSRARDSVADFVIDQAKTVNLSDPNAPTPSPAPKALEQSKDLKFDSLGRDRGTGSKMDEMDKGQIEEERDLSETGFSVDDSNDMTIASGEEGDDDNDGTPIVTFRFEHMHTDDGHHVVIGREGKLQSCEDEPITTPGAVQGFGILLVLEEDILSAKLLVRQVSEVRPRFFGIVKD